MTPAERIRKISDESIANADKSHLEPPESRGYYARVNWARQREFSRPRTTVSLLYLPYEPLHPFFNQSTQ